MMKVEILREICKGCMYCIGACKRGVLTPSEDFNTKGNRYAVAAAPEKCVGCGMCTDMCPDAAIELTEEAE